VLRSRQRGQSVIEFGIIAILFTLIMFAIADFGLLLNDWLSVSSGVRSLARDAALGMHYDDLINEAKALAVPGVSGDPYFGANGFCCVVGTPGSALQLQVIYYNECTPDLPSGPVCHEVNALDPSSNGLDSHYTSHQVQGHCLAGCLHPASPGAPNSCGQANCPGDTVKLTLTAAGAQVITPLVRPFFTNPVTCASSAPHCYITLGSTLTMRFEGQHP
jgi:hypothetical protein